MDADRFDRWARLLARRTGRRTAFGTLAGAAISAIGLAHAAPAAADRQVVCRANGVRCGSAAQCCSLDCKARHCICAPLGDSCRSTGGCCTGFCRHIDNGRAFCTCHTRGVSCSAARDCCSGRCGFDGKCTCSRLGQPCQVFSHCCGALRCRDGQCLP